jgi:outer membrane protein
MSMRLRGRLLAAIFSTGLAGAFAAPACAETLADAIALAYDSNPTLQAQRATQRALDENYVQARSGWRPTVLLQASVVDTNSRTPRAARGVGAAIDTNGDGIPDTVAPLLGDGITNRTSGSAGLSFSQPLWTGGRTAAAVSAAEADIMAGRENLRRIEAQILSTVIQAYSDTRRDQEALAIRVKNVDVLQHQLEESNARFEVGEITRTDVAQSQSRLAAAQAQYQSAVAQLAISRANYAAVVGQNPGELAPEPSLAFLLPGNIDDAFTVAEQNSPVLRAQEFAEQASRARVAGARAERMPQVSWRTTFGYSGNAHPYDSDLWSQNVQTTATITVPIFTGGLTSSRVRQSIERNNVDKINIETQRRAVLQTITQFWNQLVAARANIGSTAEQVRAATIAAEGTRQEQRVGLRTTLDVLNAEQELRSAELAQVSAARDEYVAASTVLAAMGRLEGKNLIPSVPQYDSKANFRKVRITWGWVPWEEPIGIVDRTIAYPAIPEPKDKATEAPIAPGLAPPPAVTPKAAAPAKK